MGQINVEHKKKSPWPWIIAVIVAIIIIWVVIELFDDDDADVIAPPPVQSTSALDRVGPAASGAAYPNRAAAGALNV